MMDEERFLIVTDCKYNLIYQNRQKFDRLGLASYKIESKEKCNKNAQ